MAINQSGSVYGYGITNGIQQLPPQPILSKRDPSGNDQSEVGTLWINVDSNALFINTGTVAGQTTWSAVANNDSGIFASVDITGTSGTVLQVATGGNTVLGGNLTVDGTTTISGGIVFDSVDPITLETSYAGTGAITLEATDPSGDIQIVGAGGVSLVSTDTPINVVSGTGDITIGADGTAKDITIGSSTGDSSVDITSGTGGCNIVSDGSIIVNGVGNMQIATASGIIGIASAAGTGSIEIGIGNDVSIGYGAFSNDVIVGSNTGTSSLALRSGSGAFALTSTTGNMSVGSGGTLTLESSGVLALGNNSTSQTISLGTGSANKVVIVGSTSGTSATTINTGTGALNLGTSATAHATNVGTTTAGGTLALQTPTGTYAVAANGVSITTAGRGLSLPGGILVLSGAGDPNTAVTAPAGSLFLRTDPAGLTSRAYINTDSATAWTNLVCAA